MLLQLSNKLKGQRNIQMCERNHKTNNITNKENQIIQNNPK